MELDVGLRLFGYHHVGFGGRRYLSYRFGNRIELWLRGPAEIDPCRRLLRQNCFLLGLTRFRILMPAMLARGTANLATGWRDGAVLDDIFGVAGGTGQDHLGLQPPERG
jgi:hypothetical protein